MYKEGETVTEPIWEGFMGYVAGFSDQDRQGKVEQHLIFSIECHEQAQFWVLGQWQLRKQTFSTPIKFILMRGGE